MMKNIIFIFEFVSGGGFNKVNIPISLFCEGYGMLRSIIMDFKSLNFEIKTMLDYRILHLAQYLPVDDISITDSKDNFVKRFKTFVEESEYIFIIAPESSKILYNLTDIVKKSKKILLSTNLEGIELGMSKLNTYSYFKKKKISTPKTFLIPIRNKQLDYEFIHQKFNTLKKPIIIKPEDGVGAESVYYFESQSQITHFFLNFQHKIEYGRKYLLQEFIEGKDLSVSLIGVPYKADSQLKNPLLLSINSQNIDIKNSDYESEYYGGTTPIENYEKIRNKLDVVLEKINSSIISGYYGIDFISTNDAKQFFIEINPRLTTSYIGLRNAINYNPAQLIFNSKLNCTDKCEVKYLNHSIFSRIEMDYREKIQDLEINKELSHKLMKEIPEFVTPPISLNKSNHFASFIATKSKNLHDSKKRIYEIKNTLKRNGFENIK
ncbi:MAG: ATP-grasp domain-containing protein [Promethearchaeota archaeon]|jgi:predicted ATP-grasp superfamily ATP-dependent carboligase